MPNIKSSIRSVKSDEKRRERNTAVKTQVRSAVRKTREAIAENSAEATTVLSQAASKIDVAVRKGVIHKNAAARKKSRLAKQLNKMA